MVGDRLEQTRQLISDRRPQAVATGTQLGRLIRRLDRTTVAYRLVWGHELAGWGQLRVEVVDGKLWCKVAGEVFKPSAVEYAFHNYWLTRRGMILTVSNLLEERKPTDRSGHEIFIQVAQPDRELKHDAALWLGTRSGARHHRPIA